MLIWLLISCQQKLQSPTIDVVSSDVDLACNDQLVTHLLISGNNFAPLPVGVLSETQDLSSPKLWIERVRDTHDEGTDTGAVEAMGTVDFDLSEWMTWTDSSTLEVDILPEFNLPAGTYNVHVQNPDGQQAVAEEALTIVAPPTFESVDPLMVCVDGRSQNFWVYGDGFLSGEDKSSLQMNDEETGFTLAPATEEDCFELNGSTTQSICSSLEFTLEDGSLEPGMHQGWLTNPDPASCSTVEPLDIEAVSRPHLDEVVANFECVQQGEQRIILNGSDFIVLADGTTPMVSFGDYEARADEMHGCEPLLGAAQAQTCTQMELVLPEDVQDPGVYAIAVTNPAPVDCISSEVVELELLPRPEITTLDSQLECSDQADQTISVEGTGFLRLTDGTTPTAEVGSDVYTTVLDNCTALTGPQGGETCTSMTFVLPQDSDVGVHDVTIVNPNSSECISEEDIKLEVVPQPMLTSLDSQLESIDQVGQDLHVVGSGFVILADGTQPVVTLSGNIVQAPVFSNCTPLLGQLGGETCTDIDFTLGQDELDVNIYELTVTNPAPIDCFSEELLGLELISQPHVLDVSQDLSCLDQETQTIVLQGSDFLRTHDQTLPTITVGSYTTSATDVQNCTDLNGPMGGVLCNTLTFELPVGAEIAGAHNITVSNPATAEATSEESHSLEITSTPTLSGIVQDLECLDQSSKTMTISGSGFVVLADGTTPIIEMGGLTLSADAGQNCTPLTGPQGGEVCTELLVTLAEDVQVSGVYGVTVQNPFEQTCTSTDALSYELINRPILSAVSEDVDCIDQSDRTFTLSGSGFLHSADGQFPAVQVGGVSANVDSATDCTPLTGPQGGELCDTLSITLAQSSVAPGVHNIDIANPNNTCITEEVLAIETIPAPVVTQIDDSMECLDEEDQDLVISGNNFYVPADGGYPTVLVDGQPEVVTNALNCSPLGLEASGQLCDTLHVTLSAGSYASGAHTVDVINGEPAQCSSNQESLALANSPTLTASTPLSTCLVEADQTLSLNGTDLIRNLATGEEPTVSILGMEFTPDALSNCSASGLDANFESCTDLDFTLPINGLPVGNHDITLTNPNPADCSATVSSIEVFDAPTLSGASASLTCIDQEDVEMVLYGANFLEVNGAFPLVDIGGFITTPIAMDGCVTPSNSLATQQCTQLSVLVPAGSLAGGQYNIAITNPAGAECGSSQTVGIDLIGAPVITDVRPTTACYESPNTIEVEIIGINFLEMADGTIPNIMMGAEALTPTSLGNCTPYGSTGANVCTSMFVDLDLNNYNTAASLPVQILNPPQVGCDSNADFIFELTGPPAITSVNPDQVCDDGRAFVITGTNFTNTSIVELDGVEVPSTFLDTENIEVNLPADFGEGIYDIRIVNVDQCEGTATNSVEVVTSPLPFFVDPEVIYNGINLQVTLYASDINDDVSNVIIEDSAGTQTTVAFTYDATDPNRVRFTVPAGLPSDTYNVYLEDVLGCGDTLTGAFFVEDTLTVSVDAIDPAFGSTLAFTSVEVTSDPNTGDTFQDVPRLYLNPVGSGLATELFGINYQNTERLDAIIPDGLATGFYDLIVVNPDGGVGVLETAIEVIDENLPLISSLSPGTFDTSHSGELTVRGEHLDVASASLECRAGVAGTPFTVPASVIGGNSEAYQIQVDMNAAGLTGGLVCIVDITNNSGASARFSSLSVTSPSGNLDQFYAGPSMNEARRGAPSAVGRASYSARYLYVMGGDTGVPLTGGGGGGNVEVNLPQALDSVEYAQVNRYGELQSWNYLPTVLPVPRALTTSVTIGRYIYIPGGNDGASAIADVHRTQVLDPLQAPRIGSVDLSFDAASTLDPGTWIYRISANYPAGYDDNPSGESLASDPFVIRIPDLGEALSVTLFWDPAPNATGYTIYRSPVADAASGSEEMLTIVGNVNEFTDMGGSTTANFEIQPQGSLGSWKAMPSMNVPREAACIAKARHPSDPSKYFIYVGGGRDANGDPVDSIEFLEVTEVSEHDHEVASAWVMNNLTLGEARSECGSFVVDQENNQYLASDEIYVYFGPGTDATGGVSQWMEAGRVGTDGQLTFQGETTNLYTVSSDFSYRGYFYGSAGGYLYAFGGKTGNQIRNTGQSTKICGPADENGTPICNNDDLPETSNWNNLGISMAQKRFLPSVTQESSVFFILGGESDTLQATNTVEWIYY